MIHPMKTTCGLLSVLLATGCAQVSELADDFSLRQEIHETFAVQHKGLPNGKFARHYERGWKQGYYNAALGNQVIRPSVPAGAYLERRYQNPQGAVQLESWYAGYEHGSQARNGAAVTFPGATFTSPSMPLVSDTHEPVQLPMSSEAQPMTGESQPEFVAASPIKPEVEKSNVAPLPNFDW